MNNFTKESLQEIQENITNQKSGMTNTINQTTLIAEESSLPRPWAKPQSFIQSVRAVNVPLPSNHISEYNESSSLEETLNTYQTVHQDRQLYIYENKLIPQAPMKFVKAQEYTRAVDPIFSQSMQRAQAMKACENTFHHNHLVLWCGLIVAASFRLIKKYK